MAETVEQNGPERSVPPAADAGHEPEARSQEIDREDVATTADGSGTRSAPMQTQRLRMRTDRERRRQRLRCARPRSGPSSSSA